MRGSTRSLTHGGGGDTGAVVQMVKYTLTKYDGNASRVYSVGGSSGGIMTEALLGVYPNVFMAGVSLMGVPCGCWAEGYNDVTGNGSTAQWSGPCAGGNVVKTGQAWGDQVRSYYPGYTGHRPRLQHWHGTADTTLNFKNLAEDVKEWTNLLGLVETPTGSDMPKSGTTREYWKNDCGYTVYETFALSGVAHAVPFDGNAVAAYFGLGDATGPDPETAACGGGAGGAGGMGGMGGSAGTGGLGGSGGLAGLAGATDGGAGNAGVSGGGGMTGGNGGTAGSGAGAGGAATGGSGAMTAGGSSGGGGLGGAGGTAPSAGSGGIAGTAGMGGSPAGGSGGSVAPTAGTQSSGGASTPASADSAGGCACVVAGQSRTAMPSALALVLGALGLVRRRRSRAHSQRSG